jgi:hypothetical protein
MLSRICVCSESASAALYQPNTGITDPEETKHRLCFLLGQGFSPATMLCFAL